MIRKHLKEAAAMALAYTVDDTGSPVPKNGVSQAVKQSSSGNLSAGAAEKSVSRQRVTISD